MQRKGPGIKNPFLKAQCFSRHSVCLTLARTIAVYFAVSLLLTACAKDPDNALEQVKQAGHLRVAINPDYPPFSFFGENGKLSGFDVDVVREIADRIGVELKIVMMEWTEKVPGLVTGKVDAIVGCVALSKQEVKNIQFTKPYYHSATQILVRNDGKIEGVPDLKGKWVGAVAGTTFERHAKRLDSVQVRVFETHREAFHQLKNTTIDAIVTDRVVGDNAIKTGNFDLVFLATTLDQRRVALGLRSQDQALLEEIDDILEQMQQDGYLNRFIRKVARCEYDCKVAFLPSP